MPQYKYQHKATEYLWQIKEKLGKMKTDEKRNWSDEWADWVENMETLAVVKKKKKNGSNQYIFRERYKESSG